MQDTSYDVVIVGSGVAGALIAARLAEAGASVRILEAGPRTDRDAAVKRYRNGEYAYESPAWAPQPAGQDLNNYYVQDGEVMFDSDYERRVGGTTWHWLGNCPRLLPSDFEMQTRFGVGVDWPISYDDLEPWYLEAEHELGVAGNSEHNDGSPRSGDYPMPPLPMASGDLMFKEAAASLGLELLETPQARNSVEGFQGRSICCGNAMCIPVCPVQAKYDATVHTDIAEAAGAELTENAMVSKVVVGDDGAITHVVYLDPDGTEHEVTGKIFVIAANGIETPRLLLMSKSENAPNGVANSSDQVGRNLADHPEARVSAVVPNAYIGYRGPLQLSGIDEVREGEFRGERSAMRLQVSHSVGSPQTVAASLIEEGKVGVSLFSSIKETAPYQVRLASMLEQLPDPNNRVTIDEEQLDPLGLPRPKLTYSHDEYIAKGWEAANELHEQMLEAVGATDIVHSDRLGGVGHLMGTARMGDDPETSVADANGRTHDHENLYIAGAALFPTSGTANPTLTIAALSLRTADHLMVELGLSQDAMSLVV